MKTVLIALNELARPFIAILSFGVLGTLANAQAQTGGRFEDTAALPSKDGIWLVGLATGRVKYCGLFKGAPAGATQGKCGGVSNIGASSNGYDLKPIGFDLFAVNKTSGQIMLCTVVLGEYVVTTCQRVSNLEPK